MAELVPESIARVDEIDQILPQTQCTKCGFDGCRPYSRAIASGEADINRCPPGGQVGVHRLARLLQREPKPLNPENGFERARQVALVDESRCIGCTLCLQVCPVDAIIGAPKQMHTVITCLCSGCDLCVPACPVDCIELLPAVGDDRIWDQPRMDAARKRHQNRAARLARERAERTERLARKASGAQRSDTVEADAKRAAITAAIERTQAKRLARSKNIDSISPSATTSTEARRSGSRKKASDPS